MNETLYIDRQPVDMNEDTNITLNFKSNILGDISKITASNSQTIQLPKTTRNRHIFDNPTAPAYLSKFRYKRHEAHYFRNGINVIGKAYAVLLDSSDNYEIALFWGVMANLQAWIDAGKKLNELEGDEHLDWNASQTVTALASMLSTGYGYASYDCGVSDTTKVNIHPSATAWWILNKIAMQAGFTFEMPDKYKLALRGIAIPCLSRNASAASNKAEATVSTYPFLTQTNGFWGYSIAGNNGTDKHGVFDPDDITKIRKVDGATKVIISIVNQSGAQLGMTLYSNNSWSFPSRVYVRATQYNDSSETTTQIAVSIGSSAVSSSTGMYAYQKTYYFANINEELLWGKYDYLRLFPHNGSGRIVGSRLGNTKLTITEDFESIIYPSVYPIPQNLPEITQIDFIKNTCAMLGLFVVPSLTNANAIRFVSIDTLIGNKASAVDWSSKLIDSGGGEPKTVKFRVGDFCRHNYFKYKEDDTVTVNANGDLRINDEALEPEKDVLTLQFAASDGKSIPHYELNGDAEVEKVSVKPRIMWLAPDSSGLATLSFGDLDFSSLLSAYYATYANTVRGAITIKEKIRLTELDLLDLNYTKPVYFKQYGRYYGIAAIQASGGVSECELVQLPAYDVPAVSVSVHKYAINTNGSISSIDTLDDPVVSGGGRYVSGKTVTVTESSTGGKFTFEYWRDLSTGRNVSTSSTYQFEATEDISLAAVYSRNPIIS